MCTTKIESPLEPTTMILDNTAVAAKKSVSFADQEYTIVALVEMGEPAAIWYSKQDLKEFKHTAKQLADHLRNSQALLTKEIAAAYKTTRTHRDTEVTADTDLLPTWSKLRSSRRGLERFVLDKKERNDRTQEAKASRSVVLNLQCLFQRNPVTSPQRADQNAEIIQQQYSAFVRPATILAQVFGHADAQVVLPYYRNEQLEDDDEEPEEEQLPMDAFDCQSLHSKESRDSISTKKIRRTKKSSKKEGRRSSTKSSSSSSKSRRAKSPSRSLQSLLQVRQ